MKGAVPRLARVWQGWARGVGNQAAIAVSTESLLSGEIQPWRARGHGGVTGQMGKQQEVTLWTGTKKILQ